MTDQTTHRKLKVSDGGIAGPYIWVSVDHVPAVESVLRQHQVRHWLDPMAVQMDGEPALIVINMGRGPRVSDIQSLLDAVD